MKIMKIPVGEQVGLWCLSVMVVAFFAFYLTLHTAEYRLMEETPDNAIATTTGKFLQRGRGSYIRYSFMAKGQTFTAVGWVGKRPMTWVEAGNSLVVNYDSRNPAISVLEVTGMEDSIHDSGAVSFDAVVLCSFLSFIARIFLPSQKRSVPEINRVPQAVTIALEIQNMGALATAACLFWVLGSAGIYEYPDNLVLAAILSTLPILWAVFVAHGLCRGSRVGWQASIAGDVICLGLLIWCGMRGPLGLAVSVALLGTPIILLSLPATARFCLPASPENAPASG